MNAKTPIEAIANSQHRMDDILEFTDRVGTLQGQVGFIERILTTVNADVHTDVRARLERFCDELIDELASWKAVGEGFMHSEQKLHMLFSMVNLFASDMAEVREQMPDSATGVEESFSKFMSTADDLLETVEFEVDLLYHAATTLLTLDPSDDSQADDIDELLTPLAEVEQERETRRQTLREMGDTPPLSEVTIEDLVPSG